MCAPFSPLRPLSDVSRMYSDSGVVMRMCGGRFAILVRSEDGVSPVRTAARISGRSSPRSSASACISLRGISRFLLMSFERAFSGET